MIRLALMTVAFPVPNTKTFSMIFVLPISPLKVVIPDPNILRVLPVAFGWLSIVLLKAILLPVIPRFVCNRTGPLKFIFI